jgi:CTP-dependent riboflavin kinase
VQVPHQRCRFVAVKAAAAALIVPRPTIRPAAAAGIVAQQQLRSPLQHDCRRPCWSA